MHFNQSISKQHGSVAISYLAMLIPMIIAAASTIVIGYQVQLSNRGMQATDAASLACEFSGEYDGTMAQGYLDYYRPKIDKVSGQIGTHSGCNVSLSYSLSTIFTSLTLSDASFVVSSTANEKAYVTEDVASEPLELILVLDISGSMASDLDDLKAILKRGLASLKEQQNNALSKDHIKVSIVPFSDGVSVNNAPWLNETGTFCVEGITESGGKFSAAHTVANLDITHDQTPVKTFQPDKWLMDCSAMSVTLPLTADLNQVTNAVDSLRTEGGTASYQGLIWGLRQLTPNWQKAWEVGPNRNFDKVERKLVLMTDGADYGSHFDELINAGLCDRAKDYGVALNFVGFGVYGARLEQFTRCAGDANGVFSASNTQELDSYFSQLLSVQYDTRLNFGNN
ncbi:hypothetical protein VIOR3934_19275 [Vibrio orientalis CIP 102891 = ATCC 33934]|uniref:VWFA domain-containing protein n=1 Tax=Vibrio orientalis CIP 102891 = ATCC 33934 TaxID=675816 RepID=C9QEH7_VIBOR|nr:vWA domain-containing protein [Vibrio orientalis]EEX94450.1 hypothetical protein VIA_001610 [Vibrio orientalis CIP 102891 = ATCC 33934]EGU54000.1 hypothetical protein VIOR3934_19275 [Vibrio orientalis CIP 102891 = ATCC 33934]